MSSFGTYFKVTTFGESHGGGVGCVIDGCPPRLFISKEIIQKQLDRRRPGQSDMTTSRNESDQVEIVSGVERQLTLGSPIMLLVRNRDHRPIDYKEMSNIPRPSHADYTQQEKYGIRASSGGGRSSARETIGRVAAGAVAEHWLKLAFGIDIVAWVDSIGDVHMPTDAVDAQTISRALVDQSKVRCPHESTSSRMIELVSACREASDSVGGTICCVCRSVPPGWGEPCFDKLEAMLAHAMLSIPATKGFELGRGFDSTSMRGSQHNDVFASGARDSRTGRQRLRTVTNNSGGIQGGISNGEPIVFRVAFKPPATIGREQMTVTFDGEQAVLAASGRHDPCVVPRAVAIVEGMAGIVLADAALAQLAREAAMRNVSA